MSERGHDQGKESFWQRILGRHDIFDAIEKGDNALCWKLISSDPGLLQKSDKDGRMPLHAAACKGNLEIVKMILFKGASPHGLDMNGSTPLHWAGVGGNLQIIRELVSLGASLHAKDASGFTPSQIAGMRGHAEAAELLRQLGGEK